jgi:hypothetical protein
MPTKVEIEPEALITKETESRGQLTLGSEYVDEEVTVLVVSTEDDDDESGGDT